MVYTRAHSLSKPYTTALKTKAGNGRAALSTLPLGNRLRHAPSVTAHGNHLIQGCPWPKLTWGHQQRGSMGKAEAAHHCLPSAAQTQPDWNRGLAAPRDKAHPQLLWTTNTKMLYIHKQTATECSQCKTQYCDLGILITFLYFHMTGFLRFTHNSAYLWVWRQLQYPYNTQP